jgi:hypothetical protein
MTTLVVIAVNRAKSMVISFLIVFMSSGTIGVAAINLKRQFIGIEVDADRFAVTRNRIAGAGHRTITIIIMEENKAQQPISIFRVFACMCRKPVAYFKLTIPTLKKKVKHVKYSILYYTILIIINYSIIIINYSIIRRFLVVGPDPKRYPIVGKAQSQALYSL